MHAVAHGSTVSPEGALLTASDDSPVSELILQAASSAASAATEAVAAASAAGATTKAGSLPTTLATVVTVKNSVHQIGVALEAPSEASVEHGQDGPASNIIEEALGSMDDVAMAGRALDASWAHAAWNGESASSATHAALGMTQAAAEVLRGLPALVVPVEHARRQRGEEWARRRLVHDEPPPKAKLQPAPSPCHGAPSSAAADAMSLRDVRPMASSEARPAPDSSSTAVAEREHRRSAAASCGESTASSAGPDCESNHESKGSTLESSGAVGGCKGETLATAPGATAGFAQVFTPEGPSKPAGSTHVPMPTYEDVEAFLCRANSRYCGPDQQAILRGLVNSLLAQMRAAAMRSPEGTLLAEDCPLLYADEDARNVWALEGRMHAQAREVELPLIDRRLAVQQRWEAQGASDVEGHCTAAVCWDGSVVLADLLCLPPAVLLSFSANLARSPAEVYAGWRWCDKTVVELGCGIAALPSIAAALHGARRVVSTDSSESVLVRTRDNCHRILKEHPGATTPTMVPLTWSHDARHVREQLRAAEVDAPVDVILAADCIYVLENPGAWGKLLATVRALSSPSTLVFITYTDRGHGKLWDRFVKERVEPLFHVVEVGRHALHPLAQPGTPGRLEQHTAEVHIFCWAVRPSSDASAKPAATGSSPAGLPLPPPSLPPSPPGSNSPASPHSPRAPSPTPVDPPLMRMATAAGRTEWRFSEALVPTNAPEVARAAARDSAAAAARANVQGPSWRVEAVEGKGLGVVATRDLQRGERIVQERPLISCTSQWDGGLDVDGLIKQVAALDPATREAFYALSQSQSTYGRVKTVEGIWRTNAYPYLDYPDGRKEAGVFAVACRINHACSPNAHTAWSESLGAKTVHAIRPIKRGEEITVTYIEPGSTRVQRQEGLRTKFGFACACKLCSLTGTEREASDSRQRRIHQIEQTFASHPGSLYSHPRIVELVDEKLHLYQAEGLPLEWCYMNFCSVMAAYCARNDFATARTWLLRAIKAGRSMLGADSKIVTDLEAVLAQRG